MANSTLQYIRGPIFYFDESATLENINPVKSFESEQMKFHYHDDGLLIINNGIIKKVGSYDELSKHLKPDIEVTHYRNGLITPGFIDTHIHSVQSLAVAAYGHTLMDWLDSYIFPAESLFSDPEYAEKNLQFFFDLLLRNGTTTACVYAPTQYEACDTFFKLAEKVNIRVVAGKTMMDRNGTPDLEFSPSQNYDDSKKLISDWHKKGRISYCITPRFAPSCSHELFVACQALAQENPSCYIQTHIHENEKEVHTVKELFCWSKNYLDVYDHYGLVTDKTIFGHSIHFTEPEMKLIGERRSIISWCPVSNNFLGSGLFKFFKFAEFTDNITMGTDWAAGTTPSMFAVLDDAYKVSLLQGYKLSSMVRWYLATWGAAKSLKLDKHIGNFTPGKEADFVVLAPCAIPEIAYRMQTVDDIFELLFVLMTLGDARLVKETYLAGERYTGDVFTKLKSIDLRLFSQTDMMRRPPNLS